MGDRRKQALRVQFGGKLRLEFHGAKITSDAGLLAFRELDGAFRLTDKGCTLFSDCRRGKNTFSGNKAACNAMCPTVFGTGVGETLGVNQPFFAQWHCAVGQRTHLSYWDTLVMSFMYARGDWRFQGSSLGNDFFFPGDFCLSYLSLSKGYDDTPPGGTLWSLDPSTFAVGPVLDKRMTIGAPLGGVTLTR